MSGCKKDLLTLPILTGCPANDEWVLVGNALGGFSNGQSVRGFAWRQWSSLKNCIIGKYPFKLSVIIPGAEGEDKGYTYQHPDLVGALDVDWIIVDNGIYSRDEGDFNFDAPSGTLDRFPNKFYGEDVLIVDYAAYKNISGITPTVNDPIPFSNVSEYDLEWTGALQAANGAGSFSVYQQNNDGSYSAVFGTPTPDTLPIPSNWHFDFGAIISGYILIN